MKVLKSERQNAIINSVVEQMYQGLNGALQSLPTIVVAFFAGPISDRWTNTVFDWINWQKIGQTGQTAKTGRTGQTGQTGQTTQTTQTRQTVQTGQTDTKWLRRHFTHHTGITCKHCQRHNGPEGWVYFAKVSSWGHITSSNTNWHQLKISTKHQHLHKT